MNLVVKRHFTAVGLNGKGAVSQGAAPFLLQLYLVWARRIWVDIKAALAPTRAI